MISSNDYNILLVFYNNKCTNEKNALIIKQIQEETHISISTIRKTLFLLTDLEYINKGFKHWKASSYFITEKGINYVNKLDQNQNLQGA